MSYQTLEVELENGRVRPNGPESLPPKAHALLTILKAAEIGATKPMPAERGSLAERAAHLKGIGRGEYTDLSTNKRHLDDFGK